jgi:acetyl esterase/lipase
MRGLPSIEDLARIPLIYTIPGMDRIESRKDIIYKRSGGRDLKMDVYLPTGGESGEKRPAVIFIHGGPIPESMPLAPKDWGTNIRYGKLAAASGYVGITFNHRFFGAERLIDARGDVDDLIAFVRERAGLFRIDPDRLALWAFSGGGTFLSGALRENPSYIRCLLGFYTLMDLRPMVSQVPAGFDVGILAESSPLAILESGPESIPPVFIARAGLDNEFLNGSIDRFAALAAERRFPARVLDHPQGVHGFDIFNDDDRTREIIRQALEFVGANV